MANQNPIDINAVLAFAPELSTVLDAAWIDILAYVNEFDMTGLPVKESAQTDRMARIFLAAHMGKMDKLGSGGTAGPLTSESVGGVRRSYGLMAFSGYLSSLGRTTYGQMYLEIVGMSLAHGPITL